MNLLLRLSFLFMWVCFVTPLQAQHFPDQLPAAYKISLSEQYQKNLQKLKKENIKLRDAERLAQDVTYGRKQVMSNGNIYLGWNEMEQYANQVLQQILPDSLKNSPDIKVYISRDAEENAFVMPDGSIFLNVGMMAEMANEATLAYLLGHEVAHYLKQHGKTRYLANLKSQTKLARLVPMAEFIMNGKQLKYSQEHETEADKNGFYFASHGGYDASGMISLISLMVNIEKKQQLQDKAKYEASLKSSGTHPTAYVRMKLAEKLKASTLNKNSGRLYIINEQRFAQLRDLAIQEKLNLLIKQNQIIPALEFAYVAHLIDPNNPHYINSLIDGIRKMVYLYPAHAQKGFLTSHMRHKYFEKKEGITKNISFLVQDSTKLSQVASANPTIQELPYQTYDQAFIYFSKKAEEQKQPEVYLQKALYYASDIKKRDAFLKQYLASENIKYSDYAKALLQNKLELPATGRKLMFINDIAYTKDYLYGYRTSWLDGEQKQESQSLLINSHLKKKQLNREINFTSNYFEAHINEAVTIFDIITFQSLLNNENFNKVHLSLYEPAYWQFFKANEISQLEFYKINTLDKTYKKYRHLFAIPPFTAFYLYFRMLGNTNRHSFDIASLTLSMSEKHRNSWTYYHNYNYRLTDKRLANKLYLASKNVEKEMSKSKLVVTKNKKSKK